MFGLGAGEILIILAFALIFIGPKKLPELARNLGKSIREFQKAKDELMTQVKHEADALASTDDEGHGQESHHPSLTGVDEEAEIDAEVKKMEEALAKNTDESDSVNHVDDTEDPSKQS